MADKAQRVHIGFVGSQVLATRVTESEFSRLRASLGSEGWFDLTSDDGTVALDLTKVAYVHVDHEGSRVGFGS
jgi:hypothetical protein